MAALFLAKLVTVSISKAPSKDRPHHVDSANRFFRACFSTVSERAQASNVAAETRREGNGPDHKTPGAFHGATNDPTRQRQGLFEANQQALALKNIQEQQQNSLRLTQLKKTMDGEVEATKEANQKIRDAIDGGKHHNNSH